ncbi:hypothetical protein H0H92_001669 [Tricholoma furcatifolium]|nr:hypothetical protein H0H92_001669 [Tricholoma furcatifolium]
MPFEIAADLQTNLQARYGKDKVRVLRVVREGAWHHVVEYNTSELFSDLAKVSPHILVPEYFALHLGTHFVSRYAHIHKAFITIEQLRWSRIALGSSVGAQGTDKGHPHAFLRDGDDKRVIKVEVDASAGKESFVGRVSAGISDLLVLKSTGSAFTAFIRDEYTTLAEVDDRIFSTSVDLEYAFAPVNIAAPKDEKKLEFKLGESAEGTLWDAIGVAQRARDITLHVFAEDDSASVQATLYKMAQLVLSQNSGVDAVTYSLPNKHYIPVDMRYIGVENITPP